MRLGTLARKISITPSKLTSYLESQNVDLSSGTNTKLTEMEIELALEHFQTTLEHEVEEEEEEKTAEALVQPENQEEPSAPSSENQEDLIEEASESKEELEEEKEAPKVSESFAEIALPHELEESSSSPASEVIEAKTDAETIDVQGAPKEDEFTPQVPKDLDPEIESYVERLAYAENVDVIKPAKVKLQGLTVKGKIDLPEPKPKEEEEPKSEVAKPYDPNEIRTTTGPKRERKRKPKNYKGKKYNKDYNPIEAARKKKEWEEKKRKEQEERRKKKAKAQHYNKTVQAASATPSAKKKPKKIVSKKKQTHEQPAGNMFQRFWRWMNT